MIDERIVGVIDYVTSAGDTFDMLALQLYNDEFAAGYIMDANPDHVSTLIFPSGVKLKLPIVETAKSKDTLPPWER